MPLISNTTTSPWVPIPFTKNVHSLFQFWSISFAQDVVIVHFLSHFFLIIPCLMCSLCLVSLSRQLEHLGLGQKAWGTPHQRCHSWLEKRFRATRKNKSLPSGDYTRALSGCVVISTIELVQTVCLTVSAIILYSPSRTNIVFISGLVYCFDNLAV